MLIGPPHTVRNPSAAPRKDRAAARRDAVNAPAQQQPIGRRQKENRTVPEMFRDNLAIRRKKMRMGRKQRPANVSARTALQQSAHAVILG
jgi:hypothetical protein